LTGPSFDSPEFESDYEKLLESLFLKIHNELIQKSDTKYSMEYDLYLSGTAVTVVIRKENVIYCANVGNVLALLFYAEKIYSYKFKMKELSLNNSAFNSVKELKEGLTENKIQHLSNNMITNNGAFFLQSQKTFMNSDNLNEGYKLHKNFDMNDELRRIYECGGEVRKLAGEDKFRIFVKGKYFPGLINTRSLGDQIGSNIGVMQTPHISKYVFQEKNKYYLIMCTDGVTNVLKNDAIVNIIENNDLCKIFSYSF
jgi:serine/threonine protein phosphatase PrpC